MSERSLGRSLNSRGSLFQTVGRTKECATLHDRGTCERNQQLTMSRRVKRATAMKTQSGAAEFLQVNRHHAQQDSPNHSRDPVADWWRKGKPMQDIPHVVSRYMAKLSSAANEARCHPHHPVQKREPPCINTATVVKSTCNKGMNKSGSSIKRKSLRD